MAALIRRLRATDGGSEVVEMALVTPMLLLILLGMVDFGFLFHRYLVIANATAEGARVASLPGYNATDVQTRVREYATAGGIDPVKDAPVIANTTATTIVSAGGSSPGSRVVVTHAYSFQFVGPLVTLFGGSLSGTVTLHSTSIVRHQVAAAP